MAKDFYFYCNARCLDIQWCRRGKPSYNAEVPSTPGPNGAQCDHDGHIEQPNGICAAMPLNEVGRYDVQLQG